MLKKILFAMLLITAATISAHAATPLTGEQIERVLSTLEALEPYTDQMDADLEQSGNMGADNFNPEMFNDECSLMYKYNAETKKIIESNGFTYNSWTETAGRVMKAMTRLAMQDDEVVNAEEMKQALTQIETAPGMSKEQREIMKQQLQAAMNSAEAMVNAPDEDVEAVRPYYEKVSHE